MLEVEVSDPKKEEFAQGFARRDSTNKAGQLPAKVLSNQPQRQSNHNGSLEYVTLGKSESFHFREKMGLIMGPSHSVYIC